MLIKRSGGNWPEEARQPAYRKQGAKSSKMGSILKDKVKYITEQSFRNGKDFFYE
ncbi:hypothetical protein B4120_2229 [Bacillus cereus]|nr:hypothetical protein B4120_2229 [Bacillus cereus]